MPDLSTKPLKILQLIQKPQLRGAEMFACQLSNQLIERGHEVRMISLLDGDASLPFRGQLKSLKRPLSKRLFDVDGWKQLAKEIEAFQPDIVQANAGDTLKFATMSRLFFGWKAKVVFRNANKVSDFIDSLPKLILNKFFVQRLDHVISVSELCRQDFIKTYGFPVTKTATVPIGVDAGPSEAELPEDLRPMFTGRKVLINVASFVPEKNHAGLLNIVRLLVDRGVALYVFLVGDGRLRHTIEQQIQEKGLVDHVKLLGYRNDVRVIMEHADVLLMPSKIEGLPGVILEAFYSRLPVVAYDVGGISEVVKEGNTGWLIKAGDEQAAAQAVMDIFQKVSAVEKYVTNAYAMVTTEFTNAAIAGRFEHEYHIITGGRRQAS
jgi:glycosyltransferase involved in cell wall biosynthesis